MTRKTEKRPGRPPRQPPLAAGQGETESHASPSGRGVPAVLTEPLRTDARRGVLVGGGWCRPHLVSRSLPVAVRPHTGVLT